MKPAGLGVQVLKSGAPLYGRQPQVDVWVMMSGLQPSAVT